MWVYILIGIVSFLIFYFLFLINLFIKWNNKVKEAFSTMDVYFKKRWDLIPNLVEVIQVVLLPPLLLEVQEEVLLEADLVVVAVLLGNGCF